MSFLSKLFGGGSSENAKPNETQNVETYNGFTITPAPQREGSNWRIAAKIEKDGQTHHLIRADQMGDHAECVKFSVAKAKQVIDEQGPRLFG